MPRIKCELCQKEIYSEDAIEGTFSFCKDGKTFEELSLPLCNECCEKARTVEFGEEIPDINSSILFKSWILNELHLRLGLKKPLMIEDCIGKQMTLEEENEFIKETDCCEFCENSVNNIGNDYGMVDCGLFGDMTVNGTSKCSLFRLPKGLYLRQPEKGDAYEISVRNDKEIYDRLLKLYNGHKNKFGQTRWKLVGDSMPNYGNTAFLSIEFCGFYQQDKEPEALELAKQIASEIGCVLQNTILRS
jgi:hypothetical protein